MNCNILKLDGLKVITREGNKVEFKESFNNEDEQKYAKTIAAFANNKGGHIVFGIKDSPRELVGLSTNYFEELDEETITRFLNSYFSPEISFEKYVCSIESNNLGFLEIEQSKNKPVVCIKQHNRGGIKESDIYYRYNSRTEKIKYPELKALFDEIREKERNKWQKLLKDITKVGIENIVVSGKSENNVNMRITNDPNAMPITIDDTALLKNYPLEYHALACTLEKRYTDFSKNKKFHEIKKSLINDKKLCCIRYLNPSNRDGSSKKFYSKNILKEFDKYYTKK